MGTKEQKWNGCLYLMIPTHEYICIAVDVIGDQCNRVADLGWKWQENDGAGDRFRSPNPQTTSANYWRASDST